MAMSRLEQLIAEFCPDGVEYKKLSDAAEMTRGVRVVRSQLSDDEKYPVYQNSMSPLGHFDKSNVQANTAFIISAGAAGTVGFSAVDFWAADDCFYFICPENLSSKYLYYALICKQEYLFSKVRRASVPRLSRIFIEQLTIPLPPLPVQREIVRILDNFTELTARKKQYEYYRNELLTFGDDVPMVPLGEIATDMYRGVGIKRDEVTEEGTPCVRYGEIYTTYGIWFDACVFHVQSGSKEFGHGDILFAITGESVEEIAKSCAYMGHDTCYAGGDIVVMKHNQNPRYMSYALSTFDA